MEKKKKNSEPSFDEVMKHFNITKPNGKIERKKRGPYLEPIDAYKLGKAIMKLENTSKKKQRNK